MLWPHSSSRPGLGSQLLLVSPAPQQVTDPSVFNAQVWVFPALNPVYSPGKGVLLSFKLLPQHWIALLLSIAQTLL